MRPPTPKADTLALHHRGGQYHLNGLMYHETILDATEKKKIKRRRDYIKRYVELSELIMLNIFNNK